MPCAPNRSLSAAVTQSSICRFVRNRRKIPRQSAEKLVHAQRGKSAKCSAASQSPFSAAGTAFPNRRSETRKKPPPKSARQNAQRSRAVKVSAAPNTAKRLFGNGKNAPTSKSESVQTGTSALASVFKSFHLEREESGFSRLPERVGRRFLKKITFCASPRTQRSSLAK